MKCIHLHGAIALACFTAIACGLAGPSNAQVPGVKSPDPVSPNVASIAQYGNIPVGFYTGQPNVSFPIYVIDNGYVKVPINLNYNYNGFKLEEYAGWVGLGWSLSGMGVITRQQRSLPDESLKGYNGRDESGKKIRYYVDNNLTPALVQQWWQDAENDNVPGNPHDELYNDMLAFKDGTIDTEPDMFVLSIPGHSGKFYFHDSQCDVTIKTATLVPHQDLLVKGYFAYNATYGGLHGEITKFEVTDARGVVYLFEQKERGKKAREYDADSGNPHLDFQNSWLLTKIEDPFGKTINYHYAQPRLIDMPASVIERIIIPVQVSGTPRFIPATTWESVLEKIDYRNSTNDILGEVSFSDNMVRADWNSTTWPEYHNDDQEQPTALNSISIKEHGNTIKTFDFNYSYFGDNARLRLDSFVERNGTDALPPTSFIYNWGLFPPMGDRISIFSQDHWGYYTGEVQQTLLPLVSFQTSGGATVNIQGNPRGPRPSAASAGLLKRITYPTGGTTSFEYEPNDYFGPSIDIPNQGCGEISKVQASVSVRFNAPPGPNKTETDSQIIHVTRAVCARIEYQLSPGNCIDNTARVRLNIYPNTDLFNHGQMVTHTGVSSDSNGPQRDEVFQLLPGDYELEASIECVTCPDVMTFKKVEAKITLYVSEDPETENQDFNRIAGGMRIKKIKDCAIGGASGCKSRFLKYTVPYEGVVGRSSGSLVSPPVYGHTTTVITRESGGPTGSIITTTAGTIYTGSSLLPVAVTMGNSVGYRYVTVTEAEDGSKGRTVYEFTSPENTPNDVSSSFLGYPFPPPNDREYKRGTQLVQEDFASSGSSPLSRIQSDFQYPTNDPVGVGIKMGQIFENVDGINDWDLQNLGILMEMPGLNLYRYATYRIYSAWQRPLWQTETVRSQLSEDTLSTKTEFIYGSTMSFLPKERKFIDSEGKEVVTGYKYRDDASTITDLTPPELAGILACPDKTIVVQEEVVRDEKKRTTRNYYDGPLLKSTRIAYDLQPFSEVVAYTDYDSEGKPLSFRLRSGEVHSYRYGYQNRYPILHAVGAKQSDAFIDNFEDATTNVTSQAHTGLKARDQGSYTFPSSFQPSTTSGLKMTYWYWQNDKWKFSGELNYASSFITPGTRIDDVRAYPSGALVQTFTFDPGVGMTSRMDANGQAQHFKFDEMGRLQVVRDQNKNVINYYDYFYKNGN